MVKVSKPGRGAALAVCKAIRERIHSLESELAHWQKMLEESEAYVRSLESPNGRHRERQRHVAS